MAQNGTVLIKMALIGAVLTKTTPIRAVFKKWLKMVLFLKQLELESS